ncbi:LOW QUALITY PROTEIN: pirin [Diretmus argenteus]
MNVRRIEKMVFSVEQGEGVGAHVLRILGRKELRNLDPFLMLDAFRVSKPSGLADPPHRGFETMAMAGNIPVHSGQLEPGDLQWKTTGRGVVHAEMHMSELPVVGLQLWVNLPRRDKMVEPDYQKLRDRQIPKPNEGGVRITVKKPWGQRCFSFLAQSKDKSGELTTLSVNSKIFIRILYLDFRVQGGAVHVQSVFQSNMISTASYFLCALRSHVVLIAGEPIKEPVVQHAICPFVMKTEEEIRQAVRDYQNGCSGLDS